MWDTEGALRGSLLALGFLDPFLVMRLGRGREAGQRDGSDAAAQTQGAGI